LKNIDVKDIGDIFATEFSGKLVFVKVSKYLHQYSTCK